MALVNSKQLKKPISGSFTGSLSGEFSGSIEGGQPYYAAIFGPNNKLNTGLIYSSGSFTAINHFSGPEDPTNPDVLYVSGDGINTYNLISAHGNNNTFTQINVQNYNNSTNASSDIVATADNGNSGSVYIDMGINSSGFSAAENIGGQNDAYMYSFANDLYIGNASINKKVVIFNGGFDTTVNARIYVHEQGTIGINTATYNAINPPSLQVQALNNTYNVIQGYNEVDNYSQISNTNRSGGPSASADIVAYNDIDPDNQLSGFIDMGVNSSNYNNPTDYPGWNAKDAYLFSDSPRMTIGSTDATSSLVFWVGGVNPTTNSKLTLRYNNQHSLTGSLNVTGSISVTQGVINQLTSSYATTASYWSGSVGLANTASYAVTASYLIGQSATASYALTASYWSGSIGLANTASYALTASYIQTAQTASYWSGSIGLANTASYALTASYWSGSIGLANTASYAVTASYVLTAQTASYVTNAQTASYVLTAQTASYVLSASYASSSTYANTASYVLSSSYASASQNAVTASYIVTAQTASYVLTAQTASYVQTAQTASYVLSASYASASQNAQTASYVQNAQTASYIQTAQTASYVLQAVSSSFATTASYIQNAQSASYVANAQTASYVVNAQTASYVLSSSYAATASFANNFTVAGTLTAQTIVVQTITSSVAYDSGSNRFGSLSSNTQTFTGSVGITGSLAVTQGVINQLTASYAVTASYWSGSVGLANTASYALTASYIQTAQTASYVLSASYASSSTYANTASYVVSSSYASASQNAQTASYVLTAQTASYVSTAQTASYVLTAQTASYVLQAVSSSFATTASYVATAQTASYVLQAVSASYATTASYILTAQTASYIQNAQTASYVANAQTASYVLNAISASYAATASYSKNIVISGSINNADYIDFNTSASFADAVARLGYNSGEGTLTFGLVGGNINLKVGTDLYQYVYNNTTASLTKGQVVYISGSQGNRIAVKLASAVAEQGSANTLGLVAETIAQGAEGWIMTEGNLRKLDTTGLEAGKLIFLGTTPGTYTQTAPVAPNHGVRLGYAERISNTVGSIYIKIDNGYELDELHDVVINGKTHGDLLMQSSSIWINSKQLSGSYGLTGSLQATSFIGSLEGTASYATFSELASTASFYNTKINNFITVGTSGSKVNYTSIKSAVDSITDASSTNPYTVKVAPGVYIEDTITLKSWVSIKGESHTTTIVSASNPDNSVFVLADQSLIIDMQIQGSTSTGSAAVVYSSTTTPQTNAIAYVENVRFGANYTHARTVGTGSGNCIMQCSNVKYGGYPFTLGFHTTNNGSGIGRMQLRNVTSTNGGITTTSDLVFAKADKPGCTLIVNGCLLTKATGTAAGTGFWVEDGGSLRLTAVNFQRWATAIYAPNTGSAPSIYGTALNFENNTLDVNVLHVSASGKIEGTDNFLKVNLAASIPLYEVGKDPRVLNVAKKGGDFTSVSASVAWISGSSANNRYVIKVGPGEFIENQIDLSNKPYVSIVGSDIQATHLMTSGSDNLFKLGNTNELSFMTLMGSNVSGKAAIVCSDIDGFALGHKLSIYDFDYGIKVTGNSLPTTFYGEYVDINGAFSYGTYVTSSNGVLTYAGMENYYLFPSASAAIGNFATGPSASLSLNTSVLTGDGTLNSVAFQLENGADLEANSIDMPGWDIGVYVPNVGVRPDFKMVGTMIHDSVTYDFHIVHPTAKGRFQGISNHAKINNASPDFYWNFLDDNDGENDVTRKLSVTFEDGTHTDATTLIFNGSPMGVMSGGAITIVSGLTISTAAGFGYCEKATANDVYQRIDWNDSQITLSPNTENYIYINASGLTSGLTKPSNIENIIVGRVVTNATGIEFIDQSSHNAAHTANLLSDFNREALGPVYANGSIVTENVTPKTLNVTAGSYYFSENNFTPSGTSSIDLHQYFRSGSAWSRTTSSLVPTDVYNSGSGGTLVALSASAYTKHTLYGVGEGVDEKYFLVIGQNQYSTLVDAEAAGLPTPPTYFSRGVVGIASVYVQSGSANITQIEDIRPVIGFKASGVNASSTHGNLLGLGADDHVQYLLVNGTRQMSGDLNLGGNDIYNVSSVSASFFTGSLIGVASNATTASYALTASYFGGNISNATTASYAFTASYVLTAQTASYVLQAVSASYATTASYAASIGKKVRTTIPIMAAQGQSTLITNIPLALDEVGTELRTRENLVTAVSCSVSAKILEATSAAGVLMKIQYSTDESTWNDLHSNQVNLNSAATQLTTEEAIPSGAKTSNTYLRLVTISGDGTSASNAKIGNVTLNVIYDL